MRRFAAVFMAVVLAGCAGTASLPPTSVHQPMSARPAQTQAAASDGAIYRPGVAYLPLFEDRRARNVGDTLTVNIVENNSADKKANSTVNRTSDNKVGIANVTGLPLKGLSGVGVGANTEMKFAGDGESASNNVFTGTITVTVIEVLPNGNLVVSGEKQVGIGQGSEFIRLSGVVNPVYVVGNAVQSVQVADARIEYRSNGQLEAAQKVGWLSRWFMSVSPF